MSLETVRPGRTLFRRKVKLGSPLSKPKLNLLWIHGSCAASAQYDALLEAMAKDVPASTMSVDCHLYDAFGCGESPVDTKALFEAYSTEEYIKDLKAVYHSLDHSVPTVLVGHSYAPNVILRFLLQSPPPDNVVGLVFLSSAIKGGPLKLHDGGHPIFRLPVIALNCLQNKLSQTFCDIAFHESSPQQLKQESLAFSNSNDMNMCKNFYRQTKWITANEVRQSQQQHQLPTLVIHGHDDKVITLEGGEHLSDVMKGKLVVISEASHQVMQEKPKEVAIALWSFLQSLLLK